MSGTIVLPKNVPIDSITIGKVRNMGNNHGKMAYLSLNDENFIFQLPEMSSPFGMSSWTNDDNGNTKYWIDLSFRDIENRVPLQVFKKLIEDIDEKVIQHAFDNSNIFFKKKYTNIDIVREFFTNSIKYPKDKETGEITDKWPPTFKVTLPQRDGEFNFEAYNKKKESINLKDIQTKGSKMTTLIKCGGIWIAGGNKFGITWKVVQILVVPYEKINGFAIMDNPEDKMKGKNDDEDDDNDESNDISNKLGATHLVDDDDSDDDSDENKSDSN